jgi:hypothetical protein
MKDPIVSDLVSQLKTKLEEANGIMSSLHDHDVIIQLTVGRDSNIKPTLISVTSIIQSHDYS